MLTVSLYFLYVIIKNPKTRKTLVKKFVIAYSFIFLLTFPWFSYFNILAGLDTASGLTNFLFRNVDFILKDINSTIPLVLIVISSVFAFMFYRLKENAADKEKVFFTFFFGLLPILILIFIILNNVRYLIGLIPIWISISLIPVVFLIQRKENFLKFLGVLMFASIAFTNIFYSSSLYVFLPFENTIKNKCASFAGNTADCDNWVKESFIEPTALKFPFFYYLYEITHDYDGPIEGIVNYLNVNGNENSIVFANNWYFPIQFYTNMRVLIPFEHKNTDLVPDFIVINLPNRLDNSRVKFLTDYAEKNNYKKIILPYPDLAWHNRPVMWYHKFWTQPIKVPATIYIKQEEI